MTDVRRLALIARSEKERHECVGIYPSLDPRTHRLLRSKWRCSCGAIDDQTLWTYENHVIEVMVTRVLATLEQHELTSNQDAVIDV